MLFQCEYNSTHYEVELSERYISEYRSAVKDHLKYGSPSLDKARRTAHNKLAAPLAAIITLSPMHEACGDKPIDIARYLVADHFDSTLFKSQSKVQSIMAQSSGLLI